MRRWPLLALGVVISVAAAMFPATAGSPPHSVGLVEPDTGRWHVYGTDGNEITSFYFGNPGDYPFVGDWDCDGVETPGLYRRSDGFVYLRNSNDEGVADVAFYFGNPGDLPLAGDFDGDGCDTVSIYRPSSQTFYIINELGEANGGLGAADLQYIFGDPGDKPFVGDFDADGVETVGLHRESTGLVYFRNTHTQGTADNQFIFGDPGDRIVAGDWTGDGAFSPGLFRPANATLYFRFTNSQGTADSQFSAGDAPWLPVSGALIADSLSPTPPTTDEPVSRDMTVVPGTTSTLLVNLGGSYVLGAEVTEDGGGVTVTADIGGADVVVEAVAPIDTAPGIYEFAIAAKYCETSASPCPTNARREVELRVSVLVVEPGTEVPDAVFVPSEDRWVTDPQGFGTVPGERNLSVADGVSERDARELIGSVGGGVVGSDVEGGMYQLRFQTEEAAVLGEAALSSSPLVDVVGSYRSYPDVLDRLPPPDDNDWADDGPAGTWTFDRTNAPLAWDREVGSSGVHIGVVDFGIFTPHVDLRGNVGSYTSARAGADYANWTARDKDGNDENHGTHVAGTICAEQNGIGLLGVMWDCTLHGLDMQTYPWDAFFYRFRINAWLREHPDIRIVNMSWGFGAHPLIDKCALTLEQRETDHMKWLVDRHPDVLFVTSAGNCPGRTVYDATPQNLGPSRSNVISVASHDADYGRSWFSSAYAEVAGPGGYYKYDPDDAKAQTVWSTTHSCTRLFQCTHGYGQKAGTSMASPFVAGVAGLLMSHRPNLTVDQVAACITGNGATHPISGEAGLMGIDVHEALDCAETAAPAIFTTCIAQSSIPAAECDALLALYDSTGGTNWRFTEGWRSDPDPCNWDGIICSASRVSSLALNSNRMSGPIPPEVSDLTNLTSLQLYGNQLSGSIPPELANLSRMSRLDLGRNQLSGSIPPALGNLANLTQLQLGQNQLSGSIPPALGNLANLTQLQLGRNQLSGSIPPALGNLANLTELDLSNNELTGSIPSDLGNLSSLTNLDLGPNKLSGAMPSSLANLDNLQHLSLDSNQLSGSIPSWIGTLADLDSLQLSINGFTGPIPRELGNLTKLRLLYLGGNQLSGHVPPELGNLGNLQALFVSGNQLSGPIPPDLGRLINLLQLDVGGNQLTGVIPTELGDLSHMTYLGLYANQLSGSIPPELGDLSNLAIAYLYSNRLTGEVPVSLQGLSNLDELLLRGQMGCLTAASQQLADWLAGFDQSWNDGCALYPPG